MATRKKTEPVKEDAGIVIAERLVEKISDLYAVLDESAGNSNFLKDISLALERIAVALEKNNERSDT
jgi:hypothetical protein